mgnify:CR=1 FL=1
MAKILFTASEAFPFAVSGGLGDVIGALPKTTGTIGLLDRRRMELMKEDALLVNVGRGTMIVTKDLEKLLEEMYDTAVPFRRTEDENVCKYCDLYNEKGTSECLKLNACPLFNGYVFKKSTKSFER